MAKAGRPKKGSNGLPDWFDIRKYLQAKDYGASEWYPQLSFRTVLEDFLSPETTTWPCKREFLALLTDDPHVTISRVEAVHSMEPKGIQRHLIHGCKIYTTDRMVINSHSGHGIRPVTNNEIIKANHLVNMQAHIRAKFKRWRGVKVEEKLETEKQWREFRNKPFQGFGGQNFQIVHVDLSLPTALLKRNFAEYIKSQIKDNEEVKSPFFKNQDFSAWNESENLNI